MADPPPKQEARLLELTTPLGPDALVINGFSGSEALSGLFRFHLDLLAPVKNSIKAKQLLRQPVTVSILSEDKKVRYFHGLVNRFSAGDQEQRFQHFHAEVVPWLWFLSQRSDCRNEMEKGPSGETPYFFQNKSIPEILKAVFEAAGFKDYKDKTTGDHIKLDYCTQYRETDFNFVSRLMEQDGIFYFFEHDKDKHTLIFADDSSVFGNVPGSNEVLYEAEGGMGEREDVVNQWAGDDETRPTKYILRDHNFQLPQQDLEASVGSGDLEMYDYPGEYAQRFNAPDSRLGQVQSEGEKLDRIRLEEEELPGSVFEGSSSCRQFISGHKFKLKKHFQSDGEYVLTSLSYSVGQNPDYISGRAAAPYHNSFVCVKSDAKIRPRRLTPKPVVSGPQTAVVTVKSGEESFLDKYGRVHVQFFWDRLGKKDEKSSCWIRVSQPWAGAAWGAHFWPRVGHEVVVQFLEGDPDRPLITGSLYNADNMPPYELPANYTRSGVKTRSSKGGGSDNYNEIRFEDKKGSEDLLIHAERTMHNSVEASQFITVGNNRHIKTGYTDKDGNEHGDVLELVHNNHNLHVLGDAREKIEGEFDSHVQGNMYETYDQDLVKNVTGKCVILADTIQLQGTTKIVLMAGSSSIVIDASGVTVLGTPMINLNSPGAPPTPEVPPPSIDPDDP